MAVTTGAEVVTARVSGHLHKNRPRPEPLEGMRPGRPSGAAGRCRRGGGAGLSLPPWLTPGPPHGERAGTSPLRPGAAERGWASHCNGRRAGARKEREWVWSPAQPDETRGALGGDKGARKVEGGPGPAR